MAICVPLVSSRELAAHLRDEDQLGVRLPVRGRCGHVAGAI